MPIGEYLKGLGYATVVVNFCGDNTTTDFSKLRIEDCLRNIGALIREAKKLHPVVGVGISLGGALLIEHAKSHSDLNCIANIGTPFRLKKSGLISVAVALAPRHAVATVATRCVGISL